MKHGLIVFLLVICARAAAGPSAPSTLITNIPGRTTMSLNGAWHAIVDPFDNGKAGFFRDQKARSSARMNPQYRNILKHSGVYRKPFSLPALAATS